MYYLLVFVPTLVVTVALSLGGWWLLLPPVVIFGVIPVIDHLVGLDPANGASSPRWSALATAFVPVHLVVVSVGLWRVAEWPLAEQMGGAVAIGFHGATAIAVAHELMHRASPRSRLLADVLMSSCLYPHFSIEHVQGHHRRVGTADDPATSRLGESLYAFLPRTLWGSLGSAWRIEAARGLPWWRNRMLGYGLVLGALLSLAAGLGVLLPLLVQGAVAVLLLETINYVEHYGLSRHVMDGRPERVRPEHSWNTAHRVSNGLLLNLARHSDHHAFPARSFPDLRHYDAVPQMPTGYAGMVVLATVPPLWFRVMDPRVASWHQGRPDFAELPPGNGAGAPELR
mgnify:CR=1 FL=1